MKGASGTVSLTSASHRYRTILPGVLRLYDRIARKDKPIRKLTLSCHDVAREAYEQLELFSDPAEAERDRKIQKTVKEAVWQECHSAGNGSTGSGDGDAAKPADRRTQKWGMKRGQR